MDTDKALKQILENQVLILAEIFKKGNDFFDNEVQEAIKDSVKLIEESKEVEQPYRESLNCITKGCTGIIQANYCNKCRKDWES